MKSLTQEQLASVLKYNPHTGEFVWISHPSPFGKKFIGKVAGTRSRKNMRIEIKVFGTLHQAHRLAWLYVNGEWHEGEIDHINRIPYDNRIENLRIVNRSENCQNRFSKVKSGSARQGVDFSKRDNMWRARITIDGATRYLGMFKSEGDAYSAYKRAAAEIHTHNPHALKETA